MLFLLVIPVALAAVADYGTVPKGLNPTLYASDDYVVQLDESTFNDTVYCQGGDCSAFLVEVGDLSPFRTAPRSKDGVPSASFILP